MTAAEERFAAANALTEQNESDQKRIAIIGAGAAGLMAAICAARNGARVTVFEHMQEAGIKLSLTGNGRCNYTNTDVSAAHYHCADPHVVETILSSFGYEECIAFFRELGIEPDIKHYDYDETGYVYPAGNDAAGFRGVLKREALRLGVQLKFGVSQDEVAKVCAVFAVKQDLDSTANAGADAKANAVTVEGEEADNDFDALILACGSNAYPVTGSDCSIYPVIRELGLKFHTFLPALCALFTKDPYLESMKGRRVRDKAELWIDGVLTADCSGEIQFTQHSISGIPVMQISRSASLALKEKRKVILRACGHDYEIHRTAGFDRSQVCCGGVDISEIEPKTMRCQHLQREIYICGELLDVDGECGGYNLHFAWASGYLAGRAAANCG